MVAPIAGQAAPNMICCVRLGILVRKFLMNLLTQVTVRLKSKVWHCKLQNITSNALMHKMVVKLLQWKDFTEGSLKWVPPACGLATHFNVSERSNGFWLAPVSFEPIVPADVVAAMLCATSFDGNLSSSEIVRFVQQYARSFPKRLPLKGYSAQDRVNMLATRKRLQAEFMVEGAMSRRFIFEVKVLRNELGKRRLETVKLDNYANSIALKGGSFDENLRQSYVTADASLASQRIYAFRLMGILYEAMRDFEKDITDSQRDPAAKRKSKWAFEDAGGHLRRKSRTAGSGANIAGRVQAGVASANNPGEAGDASDVPDMSTEPSSRSLWQRPAGAAGGFHGDHQQTNEEEMHPSNLASLGEQPVPDPGDPKVRQQTCDMLQSRRDDLKVLVATAKSERFNQLVKMMDEGNEKLQALGFAAGQQDDMLETLGESIEEYIVPDAKRAVVESIASGTISRELLNLVERRTIQKIPSAQLQGLQRRHEALSKQLADMADVLEGERHLELEMKKLLQQCPGARAALPQGQRGEEQRKLGKRVDPRPTEASKRATSAMKIPQSLSTLTVDAKELCPKILGLLPIGSSRSGDELVDAVEKYSAVSELVSGIFGILRLQNNLDDLQPGLDAWIDSGRHLVVLLDAFADSLQYEDLPASLAEAALKEFSFVAAPLNDGPAGLKESPGLARRRSSALMQSQATQQRKLETVLSKTVEECVAQERKNQDLKEQVEELSRLVQDADVDVYHVSSSANQVASLAQRQAGALASASPTLASGEGAETVLGSSARHDSRRTQRLTKPILKVDSVERCIAVLRDEFSLVDQQRAQLSDLVADLEAELKHITSLESPPGDQDVIQTASVSAERVKSFKDRFKGAMSLLQKMKPKVDRGRSSLAAFATIPLDAKPGDVLQVAASSGLVIQFTMPEGILPGSVVLLDTAELKDGGNSQVLPDRHCTQICLPAGVAAGSILEVLTPSGDIVQVQVPQQIFSGLLLDVPASPHGSSVGKRSDQDPLRERGRPGSSINDVLGRTSSGNADDCLSPTDLLLRRLPVIQQSLTPGSVVEFVNSVGDLVGAVVPQITQITPHALGSVRGALVSDGASRMVAGSVTTITLSVTVPRDSKPGDTIFIQSPLGGVLEVLVPEDAIAGTVLSIDVEHVHDEDELAEPTLATHIAVQVPMGALPGSVLQVATASGRVVEVIVPVDAEEGSMLQFSPSGACFGSVGDVGEHVYESATKALKYASDIKDTSDKMERLRQDRIARFVTEPWLKIFAGDEESMAKAKYEFCQAHHLEFTKLYKAAHQKRLKMQLGRILKQGKRALALKTKCLLTFLSADERKRLIREIQAPDERGKFETQRKIELTRLHERQALLDRLLAFWDSRISHVDKDLSMKRGKFRRRLMQVLEQTYRLCQALSSDEPLHQKPVVVLDEMTLRKSALRPRNSGTSSLARADMAKETIATTGADGSTVADTSQAKGAYFNHLFDARARSKDVSTLPAGHSDRQGIRRGGFFVSSLPVSYQALVNESAAKSAKITSGSSRNLVPSVLQDMLLDVKGLQQVSGIGPFVHEPALSDALLLQGRGRQGRGEDMFRHYIERIVALPEAESANAIEVLVDIERVRLLKLKRAPPRAVVTAGRRACERTMQVLSLPRHRMLEQLQLHDQGGGFEELSSQASSSEDSSSSSRASSDKIFLASRSKMSVVLGILGHGSKGAGISSQTVRPISQGTPAPLGRRGSIRRGSTVSRLVEDEEVRQEKRRMSVEGRRASADTIEISKLATAAHVASKFISSVREKKGRVQHPQILRGTRKMVDSAMYRAAVVRFDRHLKKYRIRNRSLVLDRPLSAQAMIEHDKFADKSRDLLRRATLEGRRAFGSRPSFVPAWTLDHQGEWDSLRLAVRCQKEMRLEDQQKRVDDMLNEVAAEKGETTFVLHEDRDKVQLRDKGGVQGFVSRSEPKPDKQSEVDVDTLRKQIVNAMRKTLQRRTRRSEHGMNYSEMAVTKMQQRRKMRQTLMQRRDTETHGSGSDGDTPAAGVLRHANSSWKLDKILFGSDAEVQDVIGDAEETRQDRRLHAANRKTIATREISQAKPVSARDRRLRKRAALGLANAVLGLHKPEIQQLQKLPSNTCPEQPLIPSSLKKPDRRVNHFVEPLKSGLGISQSGRLPSPRTLHTGPPSSSSRVQEEFTVPSMSRHGAIASPRAERPGKNAEAVSVRRSRRRARRRLINVVKDDQLMLGATSANQPLEDVARRKRTTGRAPQYLEEDGVKHGGRAPSDTNGAAEITGVGSDFNDEGRVAATGLHRLVRRRRAHVLSDDFSQELSHMSIELRPGLKNNGTALETRLGVPLELMLRSTVMEDMSCLAVLQQMSRDQLLEVLRNMLLGLETAYLTEDVGSSQDTEDAKRLGDTMDMEKLSRRMSAHFLAPLLQTSTVERKEACTRQFIAGDQPDSSVVRESNIPSRKSPRIGKRGGLRANRMHRATPIEARVEHKDTQSSTGARRSAVSKERIADLRSGLHKVVEQAFRQHLSLWSTWRTNSHELSDVGSQSEKVLVTEILNHRRATAKPIAEVSPHLSAAKGHGAVWKTTGASFEPVRRQDDVQKHKVTAVAEVSPHVSEAKGHVAVWKTTGSSFEPVRRQGDVQKHKVTAAREYVQDFHTQDLERLLDNLTRDVAACPEHLRAHTGTTQSTELPPLRKQSSVEIPGSTLSESTAESWRKALLASGGKVLEGRCLPLPAGGNRPSTVAIRYARSPEAAETIGDASRRAATAPDVMPTKLPRLAGAFGSESLHMSARPQGGLARAVGLADVCHKIDQHLPAPAMQSGPAPTGTPFNGGANTTLLKDMWACGHERQFVPTKRQARARAK